MRVSAGRGVGRAPGNDGAGLVAPDRAGRGPGARGARSGRRGVGTEFAAPAPTTDPVGAVVELLGTLARAVARRLGGSCEPWRLAAVISGGRLLAPTGPDLGSGVGVAGNTSRPWAGDP